MTALRFKRSIMPVCFLWIMLLGILLTVQAQDPPNTERKDSLSSVQSDQTLGDLFYDPLSLGPDVFSPKIIETEPEEPEEIPEPRMMTGYRVQLAAFVEEERAQTYYNLVDETIHSEPLYLEYDHPFYRIRIGNCLSMEEADSLKSFLVRKNFKDARIVRAAIENSGR